LGQIGVNPRCISISGIDGGTVHSSFGVGGVCVGGGGGLLRKLACVTGGIIFCDDSEVWITLLRFEVFLCETLCRSMGDCMKPEGAVAVLSMVVIFSVTSCVIVVSEMS
jgi:hypothetical protein